MTFRDFARDCCQQLRAWGYSLETVDKYDAAYMQFLAYVKGLGGNDDLRSFNDRNTREFADSLLQRGIHPNTVIRILSALATLAKYGMMRRDDRDRRLVSEDPTKSFRWPVAQRQETKFLHPEELRAFLEVEVPTWKAIPRDLLVETGIRCGEASRLNVEDFQRVSGRYYLAVKVKGRGQQRRKETRQIPLSVALGDAIRDWLLARGHVEAKHAEVALLLTHDGHRFHRASLSGLMARIGEQAGITRLRVSAHKLRHTANVVARLAGVDAPTRSRLLGHASLRSMERYEHVLPHELHDARDQTGETLQKYIGKEFRGASEVDASERKRQAENARTDAEISP